MYSLCSLLNGVRYYDLSIVSMSVMGIPKNVGGLGSIQFYLGFLELF